MNYILFLEEYKKLFCIQFLKGKHQQFLIYSLQVYIYIYFVT